MLTEKIARRRLHLTREYTTDPLETFFGHEVMAPAASAPPTVAVFADDTLRAAREVVLAVRTRRRTAA